MDSRISSAAALVRALTGCVTGRGYVDAVDRANLRAMDLKTAQDRAETALIKALSRLAHGSGGKWRSAVASTTASSSSIHTGIPRRGWCPSTITGSRTIFRKRR